MGTRTHAGPNDAPSASHERAPLELPRFVPPATPHFGARSPFVNVPRVEAAAAPAPTPTPPARAPHVATPPTVPPTQPLPTSPEPRVPDHVAELVRHHREVPLQPAPHAGSPGFHQLVRNLRGNAMLGLTLAITFGVIALAVVLALFKMLHGEPPGQH
jgi:hypothetical protein